MYRLSKLNSSSILGIILLLWMIGCSPLQKYKETDAAWALPEIEAFEALDASTQYPEDAILFIGVPAFACGKLWRPTWLLIM